MNKYRVTFDSDTGEDFIVTNNVTGKFNRVDRSKKVLNCLDTRKSHAKPQDEQEDLGETHINTIYDLKSSYTKRQYLLGLEGSKLQHIVGLPTDADLQKYLKRVRLPE